MNDLGVVAVDAVVESLRFLPNRTPESQDDGYFVTLSPYRDGAVFAAQYAGTSEWERHGTGDEIVFVLEGSTVLTLLVDSCDVRRELNRHEFLVVPCGVWHHFDTPVGVKVMSVTPQPTDHQAQRPA